MALCLLAASGCRDPTQITILITTDVECADLVDTSITVGALDAIEATPPSTTSTLCEDSGEIGSMVLLPSGDDNEPVAIRVIAGVTQSAAACVANGYDEGCIVARRALRYIPHTPLTLPVEMNVDCLDIPCGKTETCWRGECVSATIMSPASCARAGGCEPGAGDDAVDPSMASSDRSGGSSNGSGGAPDASSDATGGSSSGGGGASGGVGGSTSSESVSTDTGGTSGMGTGTGGVGGSSETGATGGSGGTASAGASSGSGGSGTTLAVGGSGGTDCTATNGGIEICDGLDNDCNDTVDESGCPSDCRGVAFLNNGYMFCDAELPWASAADECASFGMHLARIDGSVENDFVAQTAYEGSSVGVALGGDDRMVEGEWRWWDGELFWLGGPTGTLSGGLFENWAVTEPDTAGVNDCLQVRDDFAWEAYDCSQARRYVCELF